METEGNNIKGLDVEELASLARRYYAARFPNPQRLGCPLPGEINNVVRGHQAPDEALREHLFECSECFGEYRQALAQRGPTPAEVAWRKWLISVIASKRLALALTPVILVLSSFYFYRLVLLKPASEAGQITRSTPSDDRAGGGGETATNQVAALAIATIPKSPGNSGALAGAWKSSGIPARGAETIDVDLDNYQVFRRSQKEELTSASEEASGTGGAKSSGEPDVAPSGEKVISLPATRASLVLQLPETAAHGKYNVSLINAFGRSLLSSVAFSPDGAKLRVTLDLRRVPPKKYRLRLWRKSEAPAFYDVVIGAR